MFNKAVAFNQDLSGWNVRKGRNFKRMFSYAVTFDQNLRGWHVASGRHFQKMFKRSGMIINGYCHCYFELIECE